MKLVDMAAGSKALWRPNFAGIALTHVAGGTE
jgi:hypothetical protein